MRVGGRVGLNWGGKRVVGLGAGASNEGHDKFLVTSRESNSSQLSELSVAWIPRAELGPTNPLWLGWCSKEKDSE